MLPRELRIDAHGLRGGHMPLLIAAKEGQTEAVKELMMVELTQRILHRRQPLRPGALQQRPAAGPRRRETPGSSLTGLPVASS